MDLSMLFSPNFLPICAASEYWRKLLTDIFQKGDGSVCFLQSQALGSAWLAKAKIWKSLGEGIKLSE